MSVIRDPKTGPLRGQSLPGGVLCFKAVHYAEDTRNRRFQPPEPRRRRSEIADATDYGPDAPQPPAPDFKLYRSWANPQPQSEDCLTLNIWTKRDHINTKRPVMVWLHGGGHTYGSGNELCADGEILAASGRVIAVTVNHRLNAFGHLYLKDILASSSAGEGDFDASGNISLLDICEALRWIRDNIEAFGGDPARVTIYGQSGGGAKVSTLMAMPQAQGLFHRAIIQSGPARRLKPAAEATLVTETFLQDLGLTPRTARDILTMPQARITAAVTAMFKPGRSGFGPVLDGDIVPSHPFDPEASPLSANVPLMIGTTLTDMALSAMVRPALHQMDWSDVRRELAKLPSLPNPDLAIENHRQKRPSLAYFEILTDATLRLQTNQVALAKSRQPAPVFLYQLNHKTPVDDGIWGAPHGLDIPYVMGTFAHARSLIGPLTDDVAFVSRLMQEAWISFAETGQPVLPLQWDSFTAAKPNIMIFDQQTKLCHTPNLDQS